MDGKPTSILHILGPNLGVIPLPTVSYFPCFPSSFSSTTDCTWESRSILHCRNRTRTTRITDNKRWGGGEASKREKGIQRDPFRVTHSKYQTWLVYKENHSTCKGNRVAITTREGLFFLHNTVLYCTVHCQSPDSHFSCISSWTTRTFHGINASAGWERAWTSGRKAWDETMPSMPWGWAVEWG